jgi:diacylglycerol kinase-like protein
VPIGLIINPLSGRGSGRGERLLHALRGTPGIEIAVLHDFSELPAILDRLAKIGVDVLAISSGDGTIHAIQTLLAEASPFPHAPKLVLLSHGTANMSAGTLGLNRPMHEIARLLRDRNSLEALNHVKRPTLKVSNAADGKTRHGMFLGTGAVYEATAYCQRIIQRTGVMGSAAIVATFMRTFTQALSSRRSPPAGPSIIRKYELRVTADGREKFSSGGLLFLATTLDRLVLQTRPFWGGQSAPIRATVISYPVRNVARWLLTGLYGSEHRRMPQEATSFCATSLEIHGSTPYVMDGEFFHPSPNLPLHVETGPDFIYLRG